MKLLLATGIQELDSAIISRIPHVTFTEPVYSKDSLLSSIQKDNPDVLLLSDLLEGVHPLRECILQIRTQFPNTRIIFIEKEEDKSFKSFLHHWMSFDVLTGAFTVNELENAIFHPKSFQDIKDEMYPHYD